MDVSGEHGSAWLSHWDSKNHEQINLVNARAGFHLWHQGPCWKGQSISQEEGNFGSENIRLGRCFSTLKNIPYCLALRSWVYMLLSSSKIILELANLVVPFNLRLTFHRCE